MKKFLAGLAISLAATSSAFASCIGSDSFSTCTDNNGNTYNIQQCFWRW